MPTKVITIRVDESFPLTGAELMKLVKANPLLFTAAKKDSETNTENLTRYFGGNPKVMSIYSAVTLWMLEQGLITEDALK